MGKTIKNSHSKAKITRNDIFTTRQDIKLPNDAEEEQKILERINHYSEKVIKGKEATK